MNSNHIFVLTGLLSAKLLVWTARGFAGTKIASNADMHPAQIRKYYVLDDAYQALMKTAMRQLQRVAREYHRVITLSRITVDFGGLENSPWVHLAELPQYRPKIDLK